MARTIVESGEKNARKPRPGGVRTRARAPLVLANSNPKPLVAGTVSEAAQATAEDLHSGGSTLPDVRRRAAIVEGSDDAIMSVTLDGTIASWNAGATRIFGYAAAEIIGQPGARLIPAELQAEERAIVAAVKAGERTGHFDTERIAQEGRRVPVSLTVSPIYDPDGTVVGASKTGRDVTHRKRAEEAGRSSLEAALQAGAEAETANREKSDLLAAVSHEIRTPMTGMAGFIELLSRTGELASEQRRYIGFVRTAKAALLTIANEILDFSKAEVGRVDLRLRPLCVAGLIYESAAITHPAAAEKNILLRYNVDRNVPDWVLGDEDRLRRVLLNVLNHAIKFTEAGTVSVNVQSQRSADGRERVLFSIADTGVGIWTQQQDRLFDDLSRTDGAIDRLHSGAGLGLAMCKRLVNLMEGEIGVISEAGRGTTVWFTAVLPTTAAPASDTAPEASVEDPGQQKGRILLVDDVEANLEIVGRYLRDEGYGVEPCDSAAKAIALLRTAPFDLVLMDVQMPVVDGVAATKLIRAMGPPIGDIPIIALTGNVLPQQIRSFLDAGMNDHVSKPIERAALINTVGVWLAAPRASITPVETPKPDFNRTKFDELVANFGSAWVEENAAKFSSMLDGCFRSTSDMARREAHQILNFAGLLGFERLVALCREVENAPEDEPANQIQRLDQVRRAKATALQKLHDVVIPEAHDQFVAGAYSSRRPSKNIAAA
jgi:PAS domain S-box-containing protein